MAHNDRFFTIVCWCAGLITVAAFVAASVDFTRTPEPRIASIAATPTVGLAPLRSQPVAVDQVPAFDSDSLASDDEAQPGIALASNVESDLRPSGASQELRRLVAAVDALADGRMPRLELLPLPSRADILVRYDSDGRLVVADGTHRRYRTTVEALTSIDVEGLAAAFSANEPALQVAYRDMSLVGGDFQLRLAEAIDHLADMELPEVEPAMRSRGRYWGFADDDLEALSPLRKHLLLMGRDNAEAVQNYLRGLRLALALPGPPTDSGIATADLQQSQSTDDPDIIANRSVVSSAETAAPDIAPAAAEHPVSPAGPVAIP
jgi:hypothetical protein